MPRTSATEYLDRLDRYVAKGGPDECWPWTRHCAPNGYGYMSVKHVGRGAHRVAYEAAFGPIPDGMLVCHRCDNPPCCNPAHLFLGTPSDNQQDSIAKGRQGRRGSDERDAAIYDAMLAGECRHGISARHGINPSSSFYRIIQREAQKRARQ